MADNALLASLLMGQKRKADPLEGRRKYGENLIIQGSSVAPVQSPMEGVARALQAGLGGYFAGAAEREQDERSKKTSALLGRMMSAKSPQEIAEIAKEGGGDPEILNPLLGQMIAGNMATQAKAAEGARAAGAFGLTYGMGAPGAAPATGEPPPLPSGQPTASGFNNNLGNLRVSNANWQGKGAPHNGFETFNTPQDGANAMFGNLGAYAKANPSITVAQAISKWAPPNENDTGQYIRQVMEATGINPAMPLGEVLQDPAMAATLMDAMTRKEKGGLPQGVTADTFMTATTPRGAASGPPQPLQINMPQGDMTADGSGNPMPPSSSMPAPPNVPRPRPAPQQIQRYQQMIATGQMTPQQAEKALSDELDRQWVVDRENAGRRYDATIRAFEYDRSRADKEREKADKQPQQQFDNSNKLRDEFNASPAVKNYREVTPIMESMKDAMKRPSRAADLNMVYALAKIMDPGSVVREGEMIMVNNTQGIGDRMAGLINSLNGGAQLTPETRQRIIEEAQSRYRGLEQSYKALEDHYGGMADRYKLRREDVIVPIRPGAKPQETPAGGVIAQPKSKEEYDKLPPGAQYVAPDGTTRTKGGG